MGFFWLVRKCFMILVFLGVILEVDVQSQMKLRSDFVIWIVIVKMSTSIWIKKLEFQLGIPFLMEWEMCPELQYASVLQYTPVVVTIDKFSGFLLDKHHKQVSELTSFSSISHLCFIGMAPEKFQHHCFYQCRFVTY